MLFKIQYVEERDPTPKARRKSVRQKAMWVSIKNDNRYTKLQRAGGMAGGGGGTGSGGPAAAHHYTYDIYYKKYSSVFRKFTRRFTPQKIGRGSDPEAAQSNV